ncbi:MBOAT family protein [Ignavibacteriales bacterium]
MNLISFEFLGIYILFLIAYWYVNSLNKNTSFALLAFGNVLFYFTFGVYGLIIFFVQGMISYLPAIALNRIGDGIQRRLVFYLSIILMLTVLIFHKYFISAFSPIDFQLIDEIQLDSKYFPIGLSFFTFQAIVYVVDVYWEKTHAEKSLVKYLAFLGFFPTILSGPIPRYEDISPQIDAPSIESADVIINLRLILYGLFKKIVVAGFLEDKVNNFLDGTPEKSALIVFSGILMYSIQIYADFSGYSDMSIGIAGLLGVKIKPNFDLPYLATSVAEFWRSWHISLSSILNEYIYSPLNYSLRRFGRLSGLIAILVTFLICGIWHGDSLNFVIWGILNGCFVAISLFKKKNDHKYSWFLYFLKITGTFVVVSMLWVIFRESQMSKILRIYSSLFEFNNILNYSIKELLWITIVPIFIVGDRWISQGGFHRVYKIQGIRIKLSYVIYYLMILGILFMNRENSNEFIYFQF